MNHRLFLIVLCFFVASPQHARAANLAELVDTALERNISLKVSELEIEQSFIDEKIAANGLVPDVNFVVNKTHKDFIDSYQKNSPGSIDSLLTYSLNLTQAYPGLGRLPQIKREITRLKTAIKETARENQKIIVLRNLTRIYFKMVRDQELMKIHETDLFLIEALMKVARLNEELGLVLHNDILRIEVEQLNSNSELIKAKNSFGDLKHDLAVILDNQSPDSIKLDLAASLKFATASHTTEALLDELFKIDNDLNLARNDLKILNKTVQSAKSAALPTLSIDTSYKHGRKVGPIEGTRDFTTTFLLTTPVYNGNDIENAVRMARKSEEIVKLRIEDLTNSKRAIVEKAVADYNEALARIDLAEKMAEQSYENMRIVFTRYREGASSIVELIDAQRLLTSSAKKAIETYYDERERLAEILLLMHRFSELRHLDENASPLNTDFLVKTMKLGENK